MSEVPSTPLPKKKPDMSPQNVSRLRGEIREQINENLKKTGDPTEQLKDLEALKALRDNPLLKPVGEIAIRQKRQLIGSAADKIRAKSELADAHTTIGIKTAELAYAKTSFDQVNTERTVETRRADENWRMATTDSLTELKNKLGFDLQLQEMLKEARDQSLPMAIILLDVNDLKKLNEMGGHAAGDSLLLAVGGVLSENQRKDEPAIQFSDYEDVNGRLGGDEFGIILKNVTNEGIQKYWERLSEKFNSTKLTLPNGESHQIGLGAGYYLVKPDYLAGLADSDMPGFAKTIKTFADEAMYVAKYRSKKNGRSRIELFNADAIPQLSLDEKAAVDAYRLEQSQARDNK